MFMSFILRSALQGIGNSITPLVVQSVTVFLNIILDPVFIFGFGPIPAMTVRGAAYATVLARMVASFIALIILIKGSKGIKLHFKDMIPAMGISQATSVLVGQQLGAKNIANVKKIVKHSFITIIIFISIGMTATFFKGNSVVKFFVDNPDDIWIIKP